MVQEDYNLDSLQPGTSFRKRIVVIVLSAAVGSIALGTCLTVELQWAWLSLLFGVFSRVVLCVLCVLLPVLVCAILSRTKAHTSLALLTSYFVGSLAVVWVYSLLDQSLLNRSGGIKLLLVPLLSMLPGFPVVGTVFFLVGPQLERGRILSVVACGSMLLVLSYGWFLAFVAIVGPDGGYGRYDTPSGVLFVLLTPGLACFPLTFATTASMLMCNTNDSKAGFRNRRNILRVIAPMAGAILTIAVLSRIPRCIRNRELAKAIESNETARASNLLKRGVDLDALDAAGWAPLHYAVANHNSALASLILKMGGDVDITTNQQSFTPLHLAAIQGNDEIAQLLIDNGANLNACTFDCQPRTPLYYAVFYGYKKVVDTLVQNGADVNLKDGWGKTALDTARERGFDHIAEILRQHDGKSGKELK
ncbi:MAG: ankyrin repeat domain-containing protein [Planctomycetota bacterium]